MGNIMQFREEGMLKVLSPIVRVNHERSSVCPIWRPTDIICRLVVLHKITSLVFSEGQLSLLPPPTPSFSEYGLAEFLPGKLPTPLTACKS